MSAPDILFMFVVALFNSLVIIGWNKATYFYAEKDTLDYIEAMRIGKHTCWESQVYKGISDKMIFWKLRFWSIKFLGEFWSKPLFTCPTCMASVHSTYVFWSFMPWTMASLCVYPLYILMLSGMVTYINSRI